MSDVVELPADLRKALDGRDLQTKIGQTYLLVTVDADGAPRMCMLSAGEVVVAGPDRLRVGLWRGTHTSENLARGGSCLFCYVAAGTVLYAWAFPTELTVPAEARLKVFELQVTALRNDEHPGMPVAAPIRFEVADADRDRVLERWTRQVELLVSAG
jgi:hypothetical protein